jgi:magnesium transporter
MAINLFQKTLNGPILLSPEANPDLMQKDLLWVDLITPNSQEEAAVEARFKIDAPSEAERAALEESARFYVENDTLVMNVTIMARGAPNPLLKPKTKHQEVQHHRQILSFFLTPATLITVRHCPLRAFDVTGGRASADLSADKTAADVLLSLAESLVERAADFLGASASELEDLNVRVLIGHKQVRLETILRRLGQLGAGASQTRDSLASLSRMIQFATAHAKTFNINIRRLALLSTDIATLQRQAEALKTDLTFALDSTLGLVTARQNDTLRAMAIVTLIFVPPTLIASAFGMNFESMTIFKDPHGPWWAALSMALSSLVIVTVARLGKWL